MLGIATLAVLTLVALIVYYRPTIEYAYVDIMDRRQVPPWLSFVLGGSLVLLIASGLVWLRRKARAGG